MTFGSPRGLTLDASRKGEQPAARFVRRCNIIPGALVLAGVVFAAGASARAGITLYVDSSGPGPGDGQSWCNAYADFQTALRDAQDNLDLVTEIRVAAGTYTPTGPDGLRTTTFILPTRDVAIYGGYAGCSADDPDERNLAAYHTILSGDLNADDHVPCTTDAECASRLGACYEDFCIGENSFHVVSVGGTASTVLLDGFIIEGGNANGSGSASDRGGGIFVFHAAADLTIRNCIIRRNTASAKGGGMYNYLMTGKLINCLFTGNWAPDGGAIFNVDSPFELINCTLSDNTATRNVGGILLTDFYSGPSLTNCIFWGNSDSRGENQHTQINLMDRPVVANYNCIQGWTGLHPGIGNFGDDPLFVDADGADDVAGTSDDDLRLQLGSRSINTGDPGFVAEPGETDIRGIPRVLCAQVDRGAYESGLGDLDCDANVDLSDFANWSTCMTGPTGDGVPEGCEPFDFNGDQDVDLKDFTEFQTTFTPTTQ